MICTCEPRMISRPFTRTKFGRERRMSGLRMSVNSSRDALRVSAIRLYRKKSRGNSRKLWYSVLTQARVAELADAEVSKTFVERRVSSSLTSGTKKSKLSREEGFFHMDVPSHGRDCGRAHDVLITFHSRLQNAIRGVIIPPCVKRDGTCVPTYVAPRAAAWSDKFYTTLWSCRMRAAIVSQRCKAWEFFMRRAAQAVMLRASQRREGVEDSQERGSSHKRRDYVAYVPTHWGGRHAAWSLWNSRRIAYCE